MVKLKDIAEKAGVNVSTVSRALNGSRDISSETRELVQRIATELGYRPNAAAQALAGKGSRLIGVIMPELESNYFARILHHLQEHLAARGYAMLTAVSGFKLEKEVEALQLMCTRQVDGIFIACSMFKDITKHLDAVKNNFGIPVVLLEALTHLPNYDYVMIDDTYGMTLAVAHLLKKGHTRIGFVTDDMNMPIRYPMFQKAMKANGVGVDSHFVKSVPERFEMGGYLAMRALLQSPELPTAILAGYDDVAVGALRALYEAGLHPPQDCAVIGNDNVRQSGYLYQSLTTISPPVREMARMGVELMVEKIENAENTVIHNIKIKPELVIRETA